LIEYQKAPRRAFTKNASIVSISLKSEDFSPFGASACTKNEEEPRYLRMGSENDSHAPNICRPHGDLLGGDLKLWSWL
jgi:hypothetical protein